MWRDSRVLIWALAPCLAFASPAAADNFFEEIVEEVVEPLAEGIGDALEGLGKEAEKLVKKSIHEIGSAGEHLKVLIETGKCGGDICEALDAVVNYTEAMIVDTGQSIENAAVRIAEGKPFDAVWHLTTDPWKNMSDNAAEAAARSSVLRAVGQAASSAYGGPGGTAAYAAWLAYYATDGDLELALKAGAIAGATAYAMNVVSTDIDGVDVIENVKIDEIIQRGAAAGAIAGTAVALSGGSQADIEEAVAAGVTMSVIRDGYRELTTVDLDDKSLKSSTGEPYCLAAKPGSGLDCLPPDEAYIREPDGSISYDKYGKPKIDVSLLKAERPHVGMFAEGPNDSFYELSETSDPMVLVSKVPGMNAMAVAHDIFDIKFNPETTAALEMIVRIGTIAPAVVVTYEGAGYHVHEIIRKEIAERSINDKTSQSSDAVVPATDQPTPQQPSAMPIGDNDKTSATQIRSLVCTKDGDVRNTLFEIPLDPIEPDGSTRICSIDRQTKTGWQHLWHAHYEVASCIERFNDLMRKNIAQGRTCYLSVGVRYDSTASIAEQ